MSRPKWRPEKLPESRRWKGKWCCSWSPDAGDEFAEACGKIHGTRLVSKRHCAKLNRATQ